MLMPFLLQYLIKFSLSLVVLYAFYRLVLRPLTFYQWNRFYLLVYSLMSFLIPFIDITPWVKQQGIDKSKLLNAIPSLISYNFLSSNENIAASSFWQRLTVIDWCLLFFAIGVFIMLARMLFQYLSLQVIRKKATLLNEGSDVLLFETDAPISPFSFGSAIYFNPSLHTREELQRIIQHEFVHVKQKHTIDLLVGELLCIVNWYNPFAWAIRYFIRKNLEFIADNNVLENGIDKKEYQYLLLKVVGAPTYRIANNFNFSNLKKRIAMMNKMKSAKLHLTKFLFVLPLLAVVLLAFRNTGHSKGYPTVKYIAIAFDVQTHQPLKGVQVKDKLTGLHATSDENGYLEISFPPEKSRSVQLEIYKQGFKRQVSAFNYVQNVNKGAAFTVLVGFDTGNENEPCSRCFTAMSMINENNPAPGYPEAKSVFESYIKGNKNGKGSDLFTIKGDTEPPPPPPATDIAPVPEPPVVKFPENAENISFQRDINKQKGTSINSVTVTLKNGTKEVYNLNNAKDKTDFIKKYGEIPPALPPAAPKLPNAPVPAAAIQGVTIEESVPVSTNAVEPVVGSGVVSSVKGNFVVRPVVSVATNPPLYVIDGEVQSIGVTINTIIKPERIESICVIKGKSGETLYGEKGKNGVVEITSRKPLVVLDSVVQSVNVNIENVVKPENIERVNVITNTDATTKYGQAGKNGVVEITTKTPLYIVDAVEQPLGKKVLKELNPADIESVSVLKDESAKSAYGEKGKNGVIIIVTKKKAGQK